MESARTRALDAWKVLRKSHKRHPNCDLAFQAWVAYSMRFILAGDLEYEWKTFGGIGLQSAHLGAVPQMAIAENVTTSQLYGARVRTYAGE